MSLTIDTSSFMRGDISKSSSRWVSYWMAIEYRIDWACRPGGEFDRRMKGYPPRPIPGSPAAKGRA